MSKVIQTVEELDAVLHWRGKHAKAIKELDALQQLLNQRDEQVETLKLQRQGEAAACAHEWTDDGEFTLTCTKCGKTENHEPYGWVQTRGNAINHFTQEWDVVESWEDQGFEYKAMFDHAEQPAPVAVVHPFAEKVIRKLERFQECADDGQGADIGRHWFDLLTQLGLLNRVQRSPALWEMTQQGEDALDLSRQSAKSRQEYIRTLPTCYQ